MVVDTAISRTDEVFHALSDATRRDIVARVMDSELSVTALAGHYDMSFAAVQKHVAVLERAQIIAKRRHGRERMVSANGPGLADARRVLDDLEGVWRGRLERIEGLLVESLEEGEWL
ncbi:MAG: ArsR/SmtB family transcription factor [Acidimicrobiales bacterium]